MESVGVDDLVLREIEVGLRCVTVDSEKYGVLVEVDVVERRVRVNYDRPVDKANEYFYANQDVALCPELISSSGDALYIIGNPA